MNQVEIESMIRSVLDKMNSPQQATSSNNTVSSNSACSHQAKVSDYPLASVHPDWVKTATGKTLSELTLDNVLNGHVTANDVRITPEVLRIQAAIARDAGRDKLAMNFERAAELTKVPDERILEIYNALRPYRSSKAELLAIANELEQKYQANICAAFVREAAGLYEQRKKLKGDN